MITSGDIYNAYLDCRKKKRNTASAIEYSINLENNLMDLKDRINNCTYQPKKSTCFVVRKPRYREVFAANFEDRIVHHLAAIRLIPIFENVLSPRTFNCRVGKGQLYGIKTLEQDIKDCSANYTKSCWILKLDIKGFFMSIDKTIMSKMIDDLIVKEYNDDVDKETLRYICRILIMHHPEKNCIRKSPDSYWDKLPENKSLFTNGENKGLAIGNLFSQLFANYYLNSIDWLWDENGIPHHGRYVDDMYGILDDKDKLLSMIPKIKRSLHRLGLRLNNRKFYLQHYTKGVEFTGTIVKPYREYSDNRILDNMAYEIERLNNIHSIKQIEPIVGSINSYLGVLSHVDEYANKRRLLDSISHDVMKYIYIGGHYEKLVIKKKTHDNILQRNYPSFMRNAA